MQRAAHRETRLVREVEQLTELLSQYGIPTPSQSPGDTGGEVGRLAARPQAQEFATAPEVHPAQPQKQKRFPAAVPPPDDGSRELPMATGSTRPHAYPEGHRTRAPMNQPPLLGTSKQASDLHGNSLMQNADLVAVAMDFVLTYVYLPRAKTAALIVLTSPSKRLERPCLGHLHGDPSEPHKATGHVLTTSAQLHFASSGPVFTPPGTVRVPSYEHTPEDVLDRLLDLAPGVCSEGEVTPVQAWRYVRDRPYFGGLDALSLRRLAERLRGVVKCHG